MSNDDDNVLDHSKRDDAVLVILEPIVFHCERQPGKNFACVFQTEAVFAEVGVAFLIVSPKAHDLVHVYLCIYSSGPSGRQTWDE